MKTRNLAAASALIVSIGLALAGAAVAVPPDLTASPWPVRPAQAPVPASEPVVAVEYPTLGWLARTPMASGRWAHAVVATSTGTWPANDAYVYAISGADSSFGITAAVSRYDVTFDTWSPMAPMPTGRMQVGAVRIGDRIYVPGGYASSFAPTNALSIYDIPGDSWSAGATMPQATGDAVVGAYADRYVYVVGGYSGSADINTVQVYDTVMNSWATATSKSGTATAGLRGAVAGHTIVVVGGYSQTLAAEIADTVVGTIDANDPTVITWQPGPAYPGGPVGRAGAGVPSAAGPAVGAPGLDIVVFTGGDPNGAGTSVKADTWIYDVASGTWSSGPDKPTGVSNIDTLAGVASEGQLHIVSTGGYNGAVIIPANEWLTLGYEAAPELTLTAAASAMTVTPGDGIVYTLDYLASGPGDALAVTITTPVPDGTTFDAINSTAGWTCTPDASAGSSCVLSLGTLAPTDNGSAQFAVTTAFPVPAGVVQVDWTATIASEPAYGPEQNLADNTVSTATPFTTGDVQVSPVSGLATTEGGGTAQFDVVLAVAPSSDVTIDFASDNTAEGVPSPTTLVFTPANWNVPQTITVTGVPDFLNDGDVTYHVTGTVVAGSGNYDGVAVPTVTLINLDQVLDRIFADSFEGPV